MALPVDDGLEQAIAEFDCCGDERTEDEVAQEVNAFLKEGGFVHGIEHGLSSTYLLVDVELRSIAGYITVSVDSVRLTDSEKKRVGQPDFPDIGSIRLVMIGVDHTRQGNGLGSNLLMQVVGLARKVRELVAVRFLVADVNLKEQAWYERRGFVVNASRRENDPDNQGGTISMRLDLLDAA